MLARMVENVPLRILVSHVPVLLGILESLVKQVCNPWFNYLNANTNHCASNPCEDNYAMKMKKMGKSTPQFSFTLVQL